VNFILNPKSAILWVPLTVVSLLGLGALFSANDLAEANEKVIATQKALARADDCLWVDRIDEGHYYASREEKGGKLYETLLNDGTKICAPNGKTAQISGRVAAFVRQGDSVEINRKITERFGTDENGQTFIPPEFKAFRSTAFKSDPTKRPPAKAGKKQPSLFDWIFTNTNQTKPSSNTIK
jgi:hypothetical protein